MPTKKTTPVKTSMSAADLKKVKEFASVFCTEEEIADLLGTRVESLRADEKFETAYRKTLAEARYRLRERQLELAADNQTLIWNLGKCYLGQTEKLDEPFKSRNYDLSRLPDFYLNRIISGEDPLKVISEYEHVSAMVSNKCAG